MTRAEEIRNAIDKIIPISPSRNGRTYEQSLMATGFESGVKWADANPKSPWISVEDDLPSNHEELIENENYTKEVFVILSYNEIPSKKHAEVCYMCNKIGSYNVDWHWQNSPYYHVTHWMPIPKLEEE